MIPQEKDKARYPRINRANISQERLQDASGFRSVLQYALIGRV